MQGLTFQPRLVIKSRHFGLMEAVTCGCSSMVEQKPSKLMTRVRFPSPAPIFSSTWDIVVMPF